MSSTAHRPAAAADLARRASAEGLATALLVTIVVGSGIAAQRLSPSDTGIQLLENAIATGVGLAVLVVVFAPISGAHFNPVVTLVERALGKLSSRDAAVYIAGQCVGACVGTMIAHAMFALPLITISHHNRSGGHLVFSEVIATFGLLFVILALQRNGPARAIPIAVGGYIAAAYWFTSSTSFANPAVTLGRTLTNSFAGIRPEDALVFVLAQLLGGAVALAAARWWMPVRAPAVEAS
ncbi:MAG TPA: MIP/aquaporin family protein [Acidimicrobiia bacterium]|nr:MIP/aquaporin family protein [Acidimicrobiia bacterium]